MGQVYRAEVVTAKGLDIRGKEIRIKGEGLLAQALEHEIDHLNGVLYIDKLESPESLRKIVPENLEIDAEPPAEPKPTAQ
jgi:peptide deformylase